LDCLHVVQQTVGVQESEVILPQQHARLSHQRISLSQKALAPDNFFPFPVPSPATIFGRHYSIIAQVFVKM